MRTSARSALIAFVAVACGCAAAPEAARSATEPAAVTSGEIRLRAGESATVEGTSLVVTFDGVANDSRCRKGETCVWEGSATVRLSVTDASGTEKLELHTSQRAGPPAAAHGDWSIRLVALLPPPIVGRETVPGAYVVTLAVERAAAGASAQ